VPLTFSTTAALIYLFHGITTLLVTDPFIIILGTCESYFLRSNRISNRIGRPIRFQIQFSNRIGRIYHASRNTV